MKELAAQFARFFMVGALGFTIDAAVLYLVMGLFDVPPLPARIPSFSLAVLATWRLNSIFTFKGADSRFGKTFPRYLSANMVGLGLNAGIYSLAVLSSPLMRSYPLLALALAAGAAMFFNFAAMRLVVFKNR